MEDLNGLIAQRISDRVSADETFRQMRRDLREVFELLQLEPDRAAWVLPLLRDALDQALNGLRR